MNISFWQPLQVILLFSCCPYMSNPISVMLCLQLQGTTPLSYNPQNEMYQKLKRNVHFLRWLNGAKVIKNTDRLGAYPCFFIYYAFITYRVTLIDRVCKCLLLQYLVQRCLHLGVGVFWCICHWLLR